ncbi:MAG: cytochrome c oxidase subunit II [Dehalococcoidia bacterium]
MRRLLGAALLLGIVALLSGCDAFGGPQNTFAPGGDVAEKQRNLFLLVAVLGAIIGLAVFAVLLYTMVHFRQRSPDDPPPKQVHGNQRAELIWTILPAILMIGLAFPTVEGIIDLGRDPKDDALKVDVTALRFAWQFEYADYLKDDGTPLKVDAELHIPVDQEISVTLHSVDVIHSFAVPKLAGHLDVVPNRSNRMWFNATALGTYSGQCMEFCGIDHANMKFQVIAQTPEDFDAWIQEQLDAANAGAPPAPPEQPAGE